MPRGSTGAELRFAEHEGGPRPKATLMVSMVNGNRKQIQVIRYNHIFAPAPARN